jgi:large subunit ribosomal protein L15
MQTKRDKRSRIRAAKRTAGHGSKKKNRGTGQRGGAGLSNIGKRGSAKIQKIAGSGGNINLGKHGFKSLEKKVNAINLLELQSRLLLYTLKGKITKEKDAYHVDLGKLGYEKLLSKGAVTEKMVIKVTSATQNAVDKVKAFGGSVEAGQTEDATEEVK